jgi:putative iron-regulated protein
MAVQLRSCSPAARRAPDLEILSLDHWGVTMFLFRPAIAGVSFTAPLLALLTCSAPVAAQPPSAAAVVSTYSDIAAATFADSHTAAVALQKKIDELLAKPSEQTLSAARAAWIAAREPYMQTEVFRFGNKLVDDWEGKVNAWPLDEGLIDYVSRAYSEADTQENEAYAINVIANRTLKIAGETIDATQITPQLLVRSLHEAGGVEANVATGYHAIEFLLWGQDLNGTGKGAGNRPPTDFDLINCTGGNCDRRAQYLRVVTSLLVDQLKLMANHWTSAGVARRDVMKDGGNPGLVALFTGLGSLTYGELAGERMKLGLMIHDPEEEHDCFSDNTHNSHYFDAVGIRNIYEGKYVRLDGSVVEGPSVSDLVKAKNPAVDAKVRAAIATTMERMGEMKKRAETVEAYDQMIGEDNPEGNAVIQSVIDALAAQARAFEEAIAVLGIEGVAIMGSDSLDSPQKVLDEQKG